MVSATLKFFRSNIMHAGFSYFGSLHVNYASTIMIIMLAKMMRFS